MTVVLMHSHSEKELS